MRYTCHVSKLDPRERRYRARSDLIVAQNGEAKNPGPPLNPNAPAFAPAAPCLQLKPCTAGLHFTRFLAFETKPHAGGHAHAPSHTRRRVRAACAT